MSCAGPEVSGMQEVVSEKIEDGRLFSLDALRGLDMIFLCIGKPLVVATATALGCGNADIHPFMRQFYHYWGGFTAYDLIMPLFIFMCGAAIPLSLPKRLDAKGRPTAAFWKHVALRFAMLWVLGMASQGRLLACNPSEFAYFSNTLESIAVGYVIGALVLLIRDRRIRAAVPLVLAAVYGLLLHFGGDYSVKGNLAMKVDMLFVNAFQPCGHDSGSYTWYLTSLMFGTMTLCGMETTNILRSGCAPWKKTSVLAVYGAALWVGGLVLERCGVACIKHIFTVSFTAQAMGASVLLLAALYVLTDIWKFRRGWWLVTLYGQCALASYVCGEIFRVVPQAASKALFGGLAGRIGAPWDGIVIELGLGVVLTFFLAVWRTSRRKGAR